MPSSLEAAEGFQQPLNGDASHKSKHRHREKKHKHHQREHSNSRKRHRADEHESSRAQLRGVAQGSILLPADYNSDPESGELSDTTKLAQKAAELEQQSRLKASQAAAAEALPALQTDTSPHRYASKAAFLGLGRPDLIHEYMSGLELAS